MIRAAVFALCLTFSPAQADPVTRALEAATELEAATRAMQTATAARDQIAALTQTIQAYEDGLVAMRDGLREAQLREATLTRSFDAQSGDVMRLLSVLLATSSFDPQLGLLHPDGALASARAGMLLAEVMPRLGRDVESLRNDLEDLRALRRARQFGLLALEQGLLVAQDARVALSAAISARGPLPSRLVDDPLRLTMLANDAATLQEFAAELEANPLPARDAPVGALMAAYGTLPLPVRGTLLRRFNQPDAAGVVRPGLILATAPQALVAAPWSGTVRYAGSLRGQGQVVVLEPAEDMLMIFAGLGEVLVQTGEILPALTPLGLMPAANVVNAASGQRSETLYFEIRQAGNPIDPEPWLALTAP
ncbi:MAG: murein hydrolase activator EnvC family protein [Roseinatronobacter sp.]